MRNLIGMIHSKDEQQDLIGILEWWYNASDPAMQKVVMGKLEQLAYKITLPDAERIVKGMKPKGQNWTAKQVQEYLATKGVSDDYVTYYLVMNMAYNDYYSTAKLFGLQNNPEFFYSIARDFIEDPDASSFKVEKYFNTK